MDWPLADHQYPGETLYLSGTPSESQGTDVEWSSIERTIEQRGAQVETRITESPHRGTSHQVIIKKKSNKIIFNARRLSKPYSVLLNRKFQSIFFLPQKVVLIKEDGYLFNLKEQKILILLIQKILSNIKTKIYVITCKEKFSKF